MIFQVLGGASTWTCLLRILWKLLQNIFETTVPAYCGWWGWWYARYRKNFCLSFTEVCKQGGKCILDDLFIWSSAAAACCTAKLVCRQIEGTKQQRQMAQPKTIIKNSHCGVLYSYSHKWAFGKTYFSWDPAHC